MQLEEKVCIDKSLLGEDRHLIANNDGTFIWSVEIPNDAWTLGTQNSLMSIEEFYYAMGKTEIPQVFCKSDLQQFKELGIEDLSEIRLMKSFSATKIKKNIKNVLHGLCEVFLNERAVNYRAAHLKTRRISLALRRTAVNEDLWLKNVATAGEGQKEVVESFKPDFDGFAKRISYSRHTATGRLTIDDGPEILRLKKEYRNMIISRFDNGRIIQADYSSLEPRTIMNLAGHEFVDDVYAYIAENVLDGRLTRSKTKIVVMGILYGIGLTRLSELLGSNVDVVSIINDIRHFFNAKTLENKLIDEHKQHGFILNLYGRILNQTRADGPGLISHYIQSTATDIALIGFDNINEKIKTSKEKIVPIFILHDALFLDVHPNITDYNLKEILSAGETIEGINGKFPLKVKLIIGE